MSRQVTTIILSNRAAESFKVLFFKKEAGWRTDRTLYTFSEADVPGEASPVRVGMNKVFHQTGLILPPQDVVQIGLKSRDESLSYTFLGRHPDPDGARTMTNLPVVVRPVEEVLASCKQNPEQYASDFENLLKLAISWR